MAVACSSAHFGLSSRQTYVSNLKRIQVLYLIAHIFEMGKMWLAKQKKKYIKYPFQMQCITLRLVQILLLLPEMDPKSITKEISCVVRCMIDR